ncbi:poly-beta-1,6 N-acetyl-D-glucosamine export porin PgaA [Paralcaligenes ureilyticus]|uniref:Poly-N-acetylglucosamine porin n=1 Tax=Paralcaligenes ureilyticus TaxID=627131 RepID=A0A4R3MC75_9BURK|nr:poly-beta-1,6 N-acetyl-D-glucosamine export porin PgaA [Paralcaligenes ureilyticus]TCT10423.1 poly-N-acetylglucosamine porin [Paralcaligenes ureilyticus]
MNTPRRYYWVFAAMLLASAPSMAASPKSYDTLINEARAGNYEPALAMLREYTQQHPSDRRAAYDHIIVAQWAGKNDEALNVYETLGPSSAQMPPAALSAVARASRDTRRWTQALALYRQGRQRFPQDSTFALGEVMVLADSGETDQAMATAQSLVDAEPANPAYRLALQYVYESTHSPYDALHEADRAITLAPKNTSAMRGYILALQRAGLPEPALRLAQSHPALLNAAELRRLQGDYAAELARLADIPTRQEAERFAIADRALAQYDKLIPAWQALGPDAHDDLVRARIDRLRALSARMRMKDVVSEYEALRAQGVEIPDYALSDVATAYLYLRQPEAARDLYQRAVDSPANKNNSANKQVTDETGLFYSLMESGSYDDANRQMQAAQARQSTWLYFKGQPEPEPNEQKLAAEQTAILGRYDANDTEGAQQRLARLVTLAPANIGLRTSLAAVDRGRDQPRQAERELKMAETLAPRNLGVESEQGFTALSLQEWRQAEQLSRDTLARNPQDPGIRRLAREWEVHNKAELRVSGYRDVASNSPVAGNGDFGFDTVLYSAPIDYNWRVFGGGGYASGNFDEGRANYRWLRTGVEWRGRDLTVEAEASTNNYGHGIKPGVRLTGTYDLNDHWQIGGSAEILARATPLRALMNDISSNSVSVFARWRENEQREWKIALATSHFTDGNNRYELDISGRERLYTAPRVKLDLEMNVSTSGNSKQDTPYFNPRSDLTVLPTLNLTHVLYQHYDTELEQKLMLGAGTYTQKGFGTGAIGSIGYGLTYRSNKVFEIGASVTAISRPYDGVRERDIQFVLNMTYRF